MNSMSDLPWWGICYSVMNSLADFKNSLTPHPHPNPPVSITVHPPVVAWLLRSAADRAKCMLDGGGRRWRCISTPFICSILLCLMRAHLLISVQQAFWSPSLDSSPFSPTPSPTTTHSPLVHQLQRQGLRGLFAHERASGIACLSLRLSDKHDRH